MTWISLTIAAAFTQNLRSLLQKRLTGALSVNGAAYVRFCYAMPCAWIYLFAVTAHTGWAAPAAWQASTARFWVFCSVGALGQVLATAGLLAAFTRRSFAVGTALSKTEVVQTAIVGLLVLGEALAPQAVLGIAVSLIGVLLLGGGVSARDLFGDGRGLVLGLLAGSGFALAAVGFRGASLALGDGDVLTRAAFTLAVALTIQTLVMGCYLAVREGGQLGEVLRAWRRGAWVGVCGAAASAGWFTAMTLQTSALVRAVGQIELLFAVLTSMVMFRERITRRELGGMVTLVGGILLIV